MLVSSSVMLVSSLVMLVSSSVMLVSSSVMLVSSLVMLGSSLGMKASSLVMKASSLVMLVNNCQVSLDCKILVNRVSQVKILESSHQGIDHQGNQLERTLEKILERSQERSLHLEPMDCCLTHLESCQDLDMV